MRKPTLAFLLSACLLMQIFSFNSYGSVEVDAYTYNDSNYEKENLKFKLEGNQLRVLEMPKDENKMLVDLHVFDAQNNRVLSEKIFKDDFLSVGKTISLESLKDGQYRLDYTAYYGKYKKVFGKVSGKAIIGFKEVGPITIPQPVTIHLIIDQGQATFNYSDLYVSNLSMFNKNRTDYYALKYYTNPTAYAAKGGNVDYYSRLYIQSTDPQIIELSQQITSGSQSDYEKAKAIHEWICTNISYDKDYLHGKLKETELDAVAILKSKKTICQGYSNLNAALLRAAGISTRVVYGFAGYDTRNIDLQNQPKTKFYGSPHAWNEAYVDNRWVIIDTTWDCDNDFIDGEFTMSTHPVENIFFDPTLAKFTNSHFIEEEAEVIEPIFCEGQKIYYINEDGSKGSGFKTFNGNTYYCNLEGEVQTGWQVIKGEKYYFSNEGVMQTGYRNIDKKSYYFAKNGVMYKNCKKKIDNITYTFNKEGIITNYQ